MTADIDDPIQLNGGSVAEPPADQIALLADMGFTHAQARKALLETVRSPPWIWTMMVDVARRTGMLNAQSSGCLIIPTTTVR